MHGGLTEDEARERVHEMAIDHKLLERLIGVEEVIQGEGMYTNK